MNKQLLSTAAIINDIRIERLKAQYYNPLVMKNPGIQHELSQDSRQALLSLIIEQTTYSKLNSFIYIFKPGTGSPAMSAALGTNGEKLTNIQHQNNTSVIVYGSQVVNEALHVFLQRSEQEDLVFNREIGWFVTSSSAQKQPNGKGGKHSYGDGYSGIYVALPFPNEAANSILPGLLFEQNGLSHFEVTKYN